MGSTCWCCIESADPGLGCRHEARDQVHVDSPLPKRIKRSYRNRSNRRKRLTEHVKQKQADEEIRTLDPLLGKEMLYH